MLHLKRNDIILFKKSGHDWIMQVSEIGPRIDTSKTVYKLVAIHAPESTFTTTAFDLHMLSPVKVTKYENQGRSKQVKLLSGLMGYQRTLQSNYGDFAEFYQYDLEYSLSKKLGFENPVTAWNINPVIQQGTNPEDYTTLAARIVKCYDNSETENATCDCYTVINTKTGDGLSSSPNPFHPTGVGSSFNLVDDIMFHEWGAMWRTSLKSSVNRIIREKVKGYIKEAKNNPGWLGKEIEYKDLPDKVKEYLHSQFEI